ncbi:hypothetical protein QQ008_19955 [Fulvivirgaceae bacterium BMA10]|uniref:Tetratricopeptide repeat protein n=1 Tax=Splendidivirga corallicola TaxID=3051826 RepID=A0ABT8KSD9_9BACT|nr:hypothetical protein [Fulvivirgaceae bacterium BMA10]
MKSLKTIKIGLTILFTIYFSGCQYSSKQEISGNDYTLGEAHISVTGKDGAIPYFEKGLLLLHSFEYQDAAQAFIEAQKEDPSFVMAYWGEAMTYNHPLWRSRSVDKGIKALKKLKETREERLSMAATELERDLLESVEILYTEGDKFERDQAYADFLGKLYKKYPGNHEVAAFHALSLLGSVKEGRDDKIYGKGAIIAQSILDENPNHPGALHYLIHSYDDPDHAFRALEAANSYAKVAKDASHALHMPSHIYVALGMWNEVVSSNEDSWQASVNRMKRKQLSNDAQSYHALHWLMYGYLQQNRFNKATQIMKDMVRYTEELPSRSARDYLVSMIGTYQVETDNWNSLFHNVPVDMDQLNITVRATRSFINGMKDLSDHDLHSLDETIQLMEEDRKIAIGKMESRGLALCGRAGRYRFPNQLDIDQAHVMEMELRALLASAKNDFEMADNWFKKAVELEQRVSYSYGPPVIVKPSSELYGEWLLEQARFQEAQKQFDKALHRGPKRILSLKGKMLACRSNDDPQAETIKEELKDLLKKADPERQKVVIPVETSG